MLCTSSKWCRVDSSDNLSMIYHQKQPTRVNLTSAIVSVTYFISPKWAFFKKRKINCIPSSFIYFKILCLVTTKLQGTSKRRIKIFFKYIYRVRFYILSKIHYSRPAPNLIKEVIPQPSRNNRVFFCFCFLLISSPHNEGIFRLYCPAECRKQLWSLGRGKLWESN